MKNRFASNNDHRTTTKAAGWTRLSLIVGFALIFSLALIKVFSSNNNVRAGVEEKINAGWVGTASLATDVVSPTISTYIPLVARWSNVRGLGQVTVNSGPVTCNVEQCYNVSVTCPGVADPITADLKIGGPSDSSKTGSIFFASGYTGSTFWDFTAATLADLNLLPDQLSQEQFRTLATNNRIIIQNLWADGYQTVQVKWETKGWYTSKPSVEEGQAKLACRPATLAKWVYTQLHQSSLDKPYCFAGHSNGATQASLSLAQYGLSDILAGVVLESGPNWSRIDKACLLDQAFLNLYGDWTEIDKAFGGGTGTQPCSFHDQAHRTAFEEASLMMGNWDYHYPNTSVYFVFGGADTSKTANHGMLFRDYLATQNTPWLNNVVVPGAGHSVTLTPEGMAAIEAALRTSCVLH